MTTNRKADEAEIRRIISAWIMGLRTKDVDAVMAHAASDILSFDRRSLRAGRTAIGKI